MRCLPRIPAQLLRRSGRHLLLLLLLCAAVSPAIRGATIEVPADEPSIQAGIRAATDGDTVLVAPGVYYENICFRGKRILLTSYLEPRWERRHPEETIIDGSCPSHPDSAAVVSFLDGEDSTAVLRGFTLRGGAGLLLSDRRCGGGVCCQRAGPTIAGNLIIGNAAHCGGGIHYRDTADRRLRLTGNEIRWNAASNFGGGIWIPGSIGPGGSALRCEGNLIEGNTSAYGGALAIQYGQDHRVELVGNVLTGNFASQAGGIWCDKGHTQFHLERNLIAGNQDAALIVADYDPGSRVELLNNTIAGNGTGIDIWHAWSIELRNNIIVSNDLGICLEAVGEQAISYNDVWGNRDGDYLGCGPGYGDISDDPFFVGGLPFDYHLTAESPCIDAGDPDSPPDPDGTRADMGAYPYDQGGPASSPSPIAVQPDGVQLSAQPSAFRECTRIVLDLAHTVADLRLEICDLSGRCVYRLHSGSMGAGHHEFLWDGRTQSGYPASAGVYWVRGGGRSAVESRRLLRVR